MRTEVLKKALNIPTTCKTTGSEWSGERQKSRNEMRLSKEALAVDKTAPGLIAAEREVQS